MAKPQAAIGEAGASAAVAIEVVAEVVAVVGIPAAIAEPITGPAIGLFLILGAIFASLLDTATMPGEPTNPPPPTSWPTTISTTRSSSSTSSSCSPTLSTTEMVVLVKPTIGDAAYREIIEIVGKENVLEEDNVDEIGYRAFLARMDDCLGDELLENPSVETVSLNSRNPFEPHAADAISTSGIFSHFNETLSALNEAHVLPPALPNNTNARPHTRDISADSNLRLQHAQRLDTGEPGAGIWGRFHQDSSPKHLEWLSAPWTHKHSTGTVRGRSFRASEDFAWDDNAAGKGVMICIFDTGVNAQHYVLWRFSWRS